MREVVHNRVRFGDSASIDQFNEKKKEAYAFFFNHYYAKLCYFAKRLFNTNQVDEEDLVQDLFLDIWENNRTKFSSEEHLNDYLYLSIKNKYRKFLIHKKHVDKYTDSVLYEEERFEAEMIETETISKLNEMFKALPAEPAKVLKLYVEGLDLASIAERLNKSVRTIYNQKNEGVNCLRKKFPKNHDLFFLIF